MNHPISATSDASTSSRRGQPVGNGKSKFGIKWAFERAVGILLLLSRVGLVRSFRLALACGTAPLTSKILPLGLVVYQDTRRRLGKYYGPHREIQYWRQKKEELLKAGQGGYRIEVEELILDAKHLDRLKQSQEESPEVMIGQIDQDGFVLSRFGPLRDVPTVSADQFLARKRFDLKVLAVDGYVGVRKDYCGNKSCFVSELKALHHLGLAGCDVPAIMDVDFDGLTITFSFILGPVLREELAKRGAILRDRDVDNNPNFGSLDPQARWLKRIEEGKRVLYDVIDAQFVEDLFALLKKVHGAGFVLTDIKYGNIIIEKESGKPYWVDFDSAGYFSNLGKRVLTWFRDWDIERFNLHFDTQKLTYNRLKERITSKNIPAIEEWYAPVHIAADLRIGRLRDIEVGYGRWHYLLKDNLPSVAGKRILDMGANNACISIQMLREGAREVIGIELSNDYIEQGNLVKAAFEWADNTEYDFRYVQADMGEVPELNLGEFDMVLALCSIYYLDDETIANVAQYVSTITDVFVLQGNVSQYTYRDHTHTREKSSAEYAERILRDSGFAIIRVIAPRGYYRPLIIGKRM